MISFFFSRKSDELCELEEKLKGCRSVSLSEEKKQKMKGEIMLSLRPQNQVSDDFAFGSMVDRLRSIGKKAIPSLNFQALLREKLASLIELPQERRLAFSWFSHIHIPRRAVATVTAFVLVFTLVFNFVFDIDRVEAHYATTFEEITGQVFVVRDTSIFAGKPQMVLKTDDVIRTGPGSKAVIRFLDQSVSRLDENTELKISRLFFNPRNKTETVVEIILHEGRLWSRVINLIDNLSRFQVKAKNTVAVAKKKAAFDVSFSQKGKAKVSAMQNRVDILVATDKKVIETTLMKGFTAEVKTNAPTITAQVSKPEKDVWVTENLAKDKVYIDSVKQETQTAIGGQAKVLPGNPFYAVKELSETTNIAFTIDSLERQKKLLGAAQEKLAEASVFVAKGEIEKAKSLIANFREQIQSAYMWIQENEADHQAETTALKVFIKDILNGYSKQLAVILPTDPLYGVKSVVAEAQVIATSDASEKTEEKISQASNILLEAHDLVEQGDTQTAEKQIEAYAEAISQVASDVKQLSVDAKEKAVISLLDNKVEDLKMLDAIANTPPPAILPSAPLPVLTVPIASSLSMNVSTSTSTFIPPVNPPAGMTGTSTVTAPGSGAVSTSLVGDQQKLQRSLSAVKTEALTKVGEVILDVQKTEPSTAVLKKIEDIRKIDVNGKPAVDVTITRDSVIIKSVTPTPTASLGLRESPLKQP